MKRILCLLIVAVILLALPSCFEDGQGTTEESSVASADTTSSESEEGKAIEKTTVDLFLFAGGMNMSGRGTASQTSSCPEGHGFEFRAISDPTQLYALTGDFGVSENKEYGIDDGSAKTGGMVPAFCEAYYQATGTPIVAVSCSDGNEGIAEWSTVKGKMNDLLNRLSTAKTFLENSDAYQIGKICLVWMQGEADGDGSTAGDYYQTSLKTFASTVKKRGVDEVFVIQIGNHRDDLTLYSDIQTAQRTVCENGDAVLISDLAITLDSYLVNKNQFTQEGYNLLGADAGTNAAVYLANPTGYKAPDHRERSAESSTPYTGKKIDLPIDQF